MISNSTGKESDIIVAKACANVKGFSELYKLFQQKISLSGKSKTTLKNYTRHIAGMALHFESLPTKLDTDQINDYLYLVKTEHKTPSDSSFNYMVYGLRFIFRMYGLKDKRIELPKIKQEKRLPVVLSREEVKRLVNKDYRKGASKQDMTLESMEFIRRFSMHVLPKGFVWIRHYRILSSTSKIKCSEIIKSQIPVKQIAKKEPRKIQTYNPKISPHCETETMIQIEILPKRGPPKFKCQIQNINNAQTV